MNITIKIDEQEIRKEIAAALVPEINLYLVRAINSIKPKLKQLIFDAISESEVVESLKGGQLQAELGLDESDMKVAVILNQWANSIDINFSPAKNSGGRITGRVQVSAIKSDYNDVLLLSEASYTTLNGSFIDWLEWLLLNGDKKIILDYKLGFDLYGTSRTGLGRIMIEKKGYSWGIPSQFAGTATDNFVTRAIDKFDTKIAQLIETEFTK